ncbi:hypothetical protein ABFS82_10G158800 [Erythranthe guttata]|nr:PREDICTED: glucan endo-1,3-beta-glucosidase 8-like [Erythranthe guttata]|eukprot:XP_012828187.1 PREDICTED: glucan endo-1,3-beta-glucosidase 8-like [Erythranthe guttata]
MICKIAFIMAAILLGLNIGGGEGAIGINWGRNNAQRLIPSMVVDLLLQNGVKEARIYNAQEDILRAFFGSGIDLTVTIFNFSSIASKDDAKRWISTKIGYLENSRIRRIYIGVDAFSRGITNKTDLQAALTAYTSMQEAINEGSYADEIKVTMPHPDYVLNMEKVSKPSEADFRHEIREEMHGFLRQLEANKAPLIIELLPIYQVINKKLGIDFAGPTDSPSHVIEDVNGAVYTDYFTVLHDSFVWAIKKAGVPDLDIVVGAVGWPTDGLPGANTSSAEHFYKHLLPYVTSNKGTPMRPGKPIDTYIHALTDENMNGDYFPFARHWGIYRTNGEPKYKIDLSGQGRDIFPTKANGIMRMPERWCVYTNRVKGFNKSAVVEQFKLACRKADCTSLAPGGSCSGLSFQNNVSYAFNMYFQTKFQDEGACSFGGYAVVVAEDPSTDGCVFPVEVVKGQQDNYRPTKSGQDRLLAPIFVFLLSVLWVLLNC